MSAESDIAWIARQCAESSLRLRDARNLFDALYMADALKRSRGNHTLAAKFAGIERGSFVRLRREAEKRTEPTP